MPATKARKGYPSIFKNKGPTLPLSTPGYPRTTGGDNEWLHNPLIPGQKHPFVRDQDPGRVRSVFTKGDSNTFDVVYHDKSQGVSASGQRRFSKANYHPTVHAADRHRQKATEYYTAYQYHEQAANSARSNNEANEHRNAAQEALQKYQWHMNEANKAHP
ncbi:MAG: hypothetical protein Q9190_003106 [Brigantiaea leucoxantha]